jgi:hypothetical protein
MTSETLANFYIRIMHYAVHSILIGIMRKCFSNMSTELVIYLTLLCCSSALEGPVVSM